MRRALPGRRPRWGNLRRREPFSDRDGRDRGTAVDRPLIEHFLDQHRDDVRGRALELQSPTYTRRYGAGAVTESTVLDIDPSNPAATLVADLCRPGALPADAFDCVILTQTLQYLPDLAVAVENVGDALAPGGTLLVSVPTISRTAVEDTDRDLWRLTPRGLERVLTAALPGSSVETAGYGSLTLAIAVLLGLAAEELDRAELLELDPRFPVLACGRAARPAAR